MTSSASVAVDRAAVVAPVRRRLFGGFVEHAGRGIYTGLYEPGHPTANEDGFRTDVIELVKELGVTTVRYPGGNFVSGYRWEDGIGPREHRPRRRDLAWHVTETNEVGIDEFARWARLADSEIMLAVNLGTRGIQEGLDLLEYVNGPVGTTLADLRAANGSPDPYGITMWCLGNEMDGDWQLGHLSAEDYGKLAARAAKAMHGAEPGLELVACGSSWTGMPTFGEWERVVLEHTYDQVALISCHAYYYEKDGDLGSFLASSLDMEHFIRTTVATADHVKHKLRKTRSIGISFDEWNVWYQGRPPTESEAADAARIEAGAWPVAPRQLEDRYSVADAVVVGSLLITLLRNADRVECANLAQLVNVIAPIMTEPGGPAWRQTTFFPFSVTAHLATGVVLAPRIQVDGYESAHGTAPLVDAAVTFDEAAGSAAIFLVNRDLAESRTVTIDVTSLGLTTVTEALTLHDDDVYAKNTLDDQTRVGLTKNDSATSADGVVTVTLPPVSWTALALS
ncbi:alpha-L-arabinofuranosidase C-terminal domain-containing protein [Nonomuraea sp. NPDC026600]|uniref:arabinosylfuranosidase ArfA n=1 Tax=Nonomuraea sp. NPDC026600 TaxID=3155363 RepID=UPI0033E13807